MNYILKDENAVFYECGFSCDNEIFLSLGSEKFFITDARYTLEAQENIKNATVIDGGRDLTKTARQIIRASKVKKLTYNPNDFTVLQFELLSKKLQVHFWQKSNFSQQKRIIKTDKEIQKIKNAVNLGAKKFDEIALYLQANGLNKKEKKLYFEAKKILENNGENDLSFNPIFAINQNAAKPHALPTSLELKNDDLILVDAGVKYQRYCSDRTRTMQFNQTCNFNKTQTFKDKQKQKVYNTALKAQETALKTVKPGVKASTIDKAAREVIDKAGFGKYFVHSTGHGVGLDIHELPVISQKSQTILEENMIFTVEPGIYIPNEFGVRIEDMVCVTGSSYQIL
jgi:Xaa-Pro aminopeptidase